MGTQIKLGDIVIDVVLKDTSSTFISACIRRAAGCASLPRVA